MDLFDGHQSLEAMYQLIHRLQTIDWLIAIGSPISRGNICQSIPIEVHVPTSRQTTFSKCCSANVFPLVSCQIEMRDAFRHIEIVFQVIDTSSRDLD